MSMDIESAMANVCADTSSGSDQAYTYCGSQKQFEFEDEKGKICWVEFRVGHLGDAVSLASFFSTIVKSKDKSSSSLITEYRKTNDNDDNYANEETEPSEQDLNKDIEKDTIDIDTKVHMNMTMNSGPSRELSILHEEKEIEEEVDCSQLELRLADGFGDEQNPPAFHAILAEVCRPDTAADQEKISETNKQEQDGDTSSDKETETDAQSTSPSSPSLSPIATSDDITKELCGAAIITIDWDAHRNLRYLRVEELEVDSSKVPSPDLVLRRLVLSLSTLALKTGCDGLLMKETMIHITDHDAK